MSMPEHRHRERRSSGLFLERQLEFLDVVRKVQGHLDQFLCRMFAVIDINIGFQLEAVADDLLPPLGEGAHEVFPWRSVVVNIRPQWGRLRKRKKSYAKPVAAVVAA